MRWTVAAGSVLVLALKLTSVPDPITQGKPFSAHFRSMRVNSIGELGGDIREGVLQPYIPGMTFMVDPAPETAQAIEDVGVEALPLIGRWLVSKPNRVNQWLWSIGQRVPALKARLTDYENVPNYYAENQQARALVALKQLGPRARPLLPKILPLLKDPHCARSAVMAIFYIQPVQVDEILQLTNVLTLEQIPFTSPPNDPFILDFQRALTLLTLSSFGSAAASGEPIFQSYLSASNGLVRGAAAVALARSGCAPGLMVPTLQQRLQSNLPTMDQRALWPENGLYLLALSEYGTNAASALPLLETISATSVAERQAAASAMTRIRTALHRVDAIHPVPYGPGPGPGPGPVP